LVIGIGNPDRADDGIGPLVAGTLASRRLDGVRVITRSGDALALLEDWADAEGVVLIDAAAPMSRPGAIHRVNPLRDPLPRELSRSSTHAFGIAEAIELARTFDRLPHQIVVYAVEGACFAPGRAMTANVAAVADELAERVVGELQRLRIGPSKVNAA
jgi:hydrogenase maturation protease